MRNFSHIVVLCVLSFVSVCFCPQAILFGKGDPSHQYLYGKSYALVIGIDQYKSPNWHKLDYAVRDAEAMAEYLIRQGFQVTPLYDKAATREVILSVLDNLKYNVKREDRVLVFFSGHGYNETIAGRDWGYIVPHDGKNTATYISMEDLQVVSQKMGTAKHQLFIMDCCFGGLLGTKSGGVDPNIPNYISDITRRKARQVLTAGGKDQAVLDKGPDGHSYFVGCLLKALDRGDGNLNADGFITFPELSTFVQSCSATRYSTPGIGILPDHEMGEFVFAAPQGTRTVIPPAAETPADKTKGQGITAPPAPQDMVHIRGGWFDMGSDGEDDERPVHQVYVNDFSMAKHEVTKEEFREFIGETDYSTDAERGGGSYIWDGKEWKQKNDATWLNPYFKQTNNHPVVCVSWNDAIAYCNWRSQKEGLTPVYTISKDTVSADFKANGYRLPTEAEWEYAARCGENGYKYSWGDGEPTGKRGGNIADDAAKRAFSWTGTWEGYDDGYVYTAPVGSFDPNEFGLNDMTGNVWEWCWDWYGKDYYKNSPKKNPQGPSSGSSRVARGGSWYSRPGSVRAARRNGAPPGYSSLSFGFRLSRTF